MDPIVVPGVLSYLAYGDFRGGGGRAERLSRRICTRRWSSSTTPTTSWSAWGRSSSRSSRSPAFLLWRGRLFASRGVLWVLMLAMPFPYIANQAGWMVAEVGRQPWVVYGLQRTAEGTSHERDRRHDGTSRCSGSWGCTRWSGCSTCSCVLRIVDAGPGQRPRARALGRARAARRAREGAVVINTVWFIVLAFMLAGYAVLDGFDLGVGALHLLIGRDTTGAGSGSSTRSGRCGTATRSGCSRRAGRCSSPSRTSTRPASAGSISR